MNHADFVSRYQNNQIAVDIDKNKAGFMYEQQGLILQELRASENVVCSLFWIRITKRPSPVSQSVI